MDQAGPNSPDASIFVTRQIKHNTFQYYAWKIAYVASLIVEHAWICWDLAKKLFNFLIAGSRVWVFMVARLFAFITILMPGWAALLRYYIFDSLIIRNIDFGRGPRYRNLLDVYLPQPNNPRSRKHKGSKSKRRRDGDGVANSSRHSGKAPVVVFVSGGAWIIGYKLWSGLMARELSRAGYVVIVPDYRNFPQGNIKNMIADLRAALLWTTTNCAMFGGDPEQIVLAGQSAGAHISLCALVELYEESLAKEFVKKSPLATLDLSHRTVHVAGSGDSSSEGVWRDAVSVKARECDKDSDGVGYSDDDGEEEEEDTDEEEVTVSTEVAEVPSTASSFDDRPLLTASMLRHTSMPFPSNSSDFMEYTVSQTDGPGDNGISDNGHANSDVRSCDGNTNAARHNSVDSYEDDQHVLKISDIKMFVGISGPYNMVGLMQHLHARGLDVSILHYIFAFDIKKYSPTLRLANLMGVAVTNSLSMQCVSLEESSLSIYKYLFGGPKETEVDEEVELEDRRRSEEGDSSGDESDDDISLRRQRMRHSISETSLESYVVDQLFSEQATRENVNENGGEVSEDEETPSFASVAAANQPPPVASPHQLHGFPAVSLFHGSKDKSIPAMVSDELESLLRSGGVKVSNRVYDNMSHTDPILENVLEGNTELVVDMINVIESNLDSIRSTENDESKASLKKDGATADRMKDPSHHSDRCQAYLHNNQTVSWPISKGMMRVARMMNPF